MKKFFIIFILDIFLNGLSFSQTTTERFVLSFSKPSLKDSILVSRKESFNNNEMTKQEAINFVYNKDTSLLTCHGVYYDMINEKETGKWSEIKLPKKCFRIEINSIHLIAYTSYVCQNPNDFWVQLNLVTYDKLFQVKDKLIAYKGNDTGSEIASLINAKTLKVFLYAYNSKTKMKEFSLFKINTNTSQFELIKSVQIENISTDNLSRTIEKLGFEDQFYK